MRLAINAAPTVEKHPNKVGEQAVARLAITAGPTAVERPNEVRDRAVACLAITAAPTIEEGVQTREPMSRRKNKKAKRGKEKRKKKFRRGVVELFGPETDDETAEAEEPVSDRDYICPSTPDIREDVEPGFEHLRDMAVFGDYIEFIE